jgi:hypothetical protein
MLPVCSVGHPPPVHTPQEHTPPLRFPLKENFGRFSATYEDSCSCKLFSIKSLRINPMGPIGYADTLNLLNTNAVRRKFLNHNGLCASHSSFNNKKCKRANPLPGPPGRHSPRKERIATRAPALGTGGDTDTPSAPISSLPPNGALSRLRRYRLGNCTFVTSGRQGNQRGYRAHAQSICRFGEQMNSIRNERSGHDFSETEWIFFCSTFV